MPVINSRGDVIYERTEVVEEIKDLIRLQWPRDMELLWHMEWRLFKAWIYALEPRQAMLIACDSCFMQFRELKESKGKIALLISFIWRHLLWR
jgi:hypothetical protein